MLVILIGEKATKNYTRAHLKIKKRKTFEHVICSPLMRTGTCAYQEVTICKCSKVLRYVIFG